MSTSEEMLKAEFTKAFLRIWEVQIGLPLEPLPAPTSDDLKDWVAGVVWIGGQWTGSVTLAFSKELAKLITARMLETDIENITEEKMQDAIREITNMSAGNLKSALPSPSGLATPGYFEVRTREDLANNFSKVISLDYCCQGQNLIAELHGLH